MRYKTQTIAAACIAVILVAGLVAQNMYQANQLRAGKTAATRALANYLKSQTAAGKFSGTVLVAKDGTPLLGQSYGMADRATNTPNTATTKYCIASMGKMFTAVAIAQLVQAGKLSFGDTIGKYVPGFPGSEANSITIADLLEHRSGLGDVALQPDKNGELATTLGGLMAKIVKEPLQFAPGSQFSYSNDGFIVLGDIVQNVGKQSYASYIQSHIFKPAGMADTVIASYVPSKVPGMAHGYAQAANGQYVDDGSAVQVANPSGGAYSTVGDMLKFAQALTAHKLLSKAMTNIVTTGKENVDRPGGPTYDKYAYGFGDVKINGVEIVGHNGGNPGYESQLDIYPTKGYVVVIMTNQANAMVPAIQKSEALLTQ